MKINSAAYEIFLDPQKAIKNMEGLKKSLDRYFKRIGG